ncbi:MAG: type II CAAX endopeptidase family protein [Saprospiraceae bacterium]
MSNKLHKDTFVAVITLLLLVFAGILLGMGALQLYLHQTGKDITLLTEGLQNAQDMAARNFFRLLAAGNHLMIFIIPGLVFFKLYPRKTTFSSYQDDPQLKYKLLTFGVLLIVLSMPLIQFFHVINKAIPLPDFLVQLEHQTNDAIKGMLRMNNPKEFIFNLTVIALLPAIGEELVFRGGLQRMLHRDFNPHLAILISAFIFSAIHLQFEGFLPRMVLGALLGYFYYWSGRLWVPILMHFVNNAVQILAVYLMQDQLVEMNVSDEIDFPWPFTMMSALLSFFLIQQCIRLIRPNPTPVE